MEKAKRVNRKKLMADIMAGLYEAKCDYRYTDDYAFDDAYGFGKTDFMPARVGNFETGYCSFREDYFRSLKEYGAYLSFNADGSISLSPHSNLSYTLRLKEQNQKAG